MGCGFSAMCNPDATGFAEWQADRIAELVKLTDAQRSKFDQVGGGHAQRLSGDVPETIIGRTEAMESDK
jgi:hypothetical protein